MICHNPEELLAEIKKYMYLNKIQDKELAAAMKKSPQSINQIFTNGNPKTSTLFDICKALNINLDITFVDDNGDTPK